MSVAEGATRGPIAYVTYKRKSREDRFGIHAVSANGGCKGHYVVLEDAIQFRIHSINGRRVADNLDHDAVVELIRKKKTLKLGVYTLSATPSEQVARVKKRAPADKTATPPPPVAVRPPPPVYTESKGVRMHSASEGLFPIHVVEFPDGTIKTYLHPSYVVHE